MGCTASLTGELEHPLYQSAETFHGKYAMEQELGRGCFGQVCAVRSRDVPAERQPSLAVKVVSLLEPPSGLASLSLEEDSVWRRVCDHPNVVALHATFLDLSHETLSASAFLLMERCRGPMLQCLDLGSEAAVAACTHEMLAAVAHVHGRGVVHRDVKLNNFLLGADQRIKLGDFGLACALPTCGYLRGVVGTAAYMAPEVVAGEPYTCAIDMWSYGVCCYQLVFGGYPFKGRGTSTSSYQKAIIQGTRPSFSAKNTGLATSSAAALDFIQELLQRAPDARPAAACALRHGFLEEADATSLRASIVAESGEEATVQSRNSFLLTRPIASTSSQEERADALRKFGSVDALDASLSTCARSDLSVYTGDESPLMRDLVVEGSSGSRDEDLARV